MRTIRFTCLLGLLLLGACRGFTVHVPVEPHPRPHPRRLPPPPDPDCEDPQPIPRRVPRHKHPRKRPHDPYSHLPRRRSYCARSHVTLKDGCYYGDFELGRVQLRVKGCGVGQTVIHGNLIVRTQCVVSNLTVTGNVIFLGNQARLKNVDFYGKVIDKGVQNRY